MKKIYRTLLAISVVLQLAAPVSAQSASTTAGTTQPQNTTTQNSSPQTTPTPSQTPSQPKSQVTVHTNEYSGQVLKVTKDKLTIDTSSGTKEFTVPSNVQVQRDTNLVTINEIKPGDKATVKATSSGEVLSISATGGSVVHTGKTILAGAILLLLLALLVWYMIRKRHQGFVKIVPTKV